MNTKSMPALLSCLLITSAIFLAGCGDKEEANSAPPAPQPVAPAPDVTVGGTQPPGGVVAPPPNGAATAVMPKVDDGVHESAPADADAQKRLEAALQSYVIDNSANPSSLEELVQKKYLRSLPPAPAGKKWSYSPEKLAIELVDK